MIRIFIILLGFSLMQINAFSQKIGGNGYDYFGEFVNGRAFVYSGGYWGIIDENGNEIVTPKYDKIYPFYHAIQRHPSFVLARCSW